ncbi:unnamed protein product [Adineta ricciae]|uniref:Uncharacterized protein n=1 Tax=Adineta ricciae TaxID=249248 RepID=A0A814TEJ0_ADIRI|nr:unnamed protein product [Adineta ricciae]
MLSETQNDFTLTASHPIRVNGYLNVTMDREGYGQGCGIVSDTDETETNVTFLGASCCTSSGCEASTSAGSTSQSFDLSLLCNDVTCNRVSCSTNFLGTCPLVGAAGDVDSTCDATKLTTFNMLMLIGIVIVGLII